MADTRLDAAARLAGWRAHGDLTVTCDACGRTIPFGINKPLAPVAYLRDAHKPGCRHRRLADQGATSAVLVGALVARLWLRLTGRKVPSRG